MADKLPIEPTKQENTMGMASVSDSPSTAVHIVYLEDPTPVEPIKFEEFIALPSKETGEKGDVTMVKISSGYAITAGTDSTIESILCNMADGKIHPLDSNQHTKVKLIEKENFHECAKEIVAGDLIFILNYYVDRKNGGRTHYTEYRFFHPENDL